jgi:copper chaperone CopZ
MSCGGCKTAVSKILGSTAGVNAVDADVEQKRVVVACNARASMLKLSCLTYDVPCRRLPGRSQRTPSSRRSRNGRVPVINKSHSFKNCKRTSPVAHVQIVSFSATLFFTTSVFACHDIVIHCGFSCGFCRVVNAADHYQRCATQRSFTSTRHCRCISRLLRYRSPSSVV